MLPKHDTQIIQSWISNKYRNVANTPEIKPFQNVSCMFTKQKKSSIMLAAEKTEYVLQSRHQNAGQNHDMKIGNRCFENVAQYRYLGTTITSKPDSGVN
jgi:hypothetical protein